MALIRRLLYQFIPHFPGDKDTSRESQRYWRIWRSSVILVSLVSLLPLIVMTDINYKQYHKLFRAEMIHPVSRLTSNAKRSLEFFISERQSALTLIINEKPIEVLGDQAALNSLFLNLRSSFGGFVDVGLIDSRGNQRSYVGPYDLQGKNYRDQDWFHEVRVRGTYVSEVFMGYRKFPHFVVAVKKEDRQGGFYVLRATIDTEILVRTTLALEPRPSSDVFIINRQGILQTPSRIHGSILEPCDLSVPPYSPRTEVIEREDEHGHPLILGYAYIERSPFVLMVVERPADFMKNWLSLRKRLIWFLAGSVVVIMLVVLWGTTSMVSRIQESDLRQAQVLHNVQYTSKMALIGRLAAGVAHEINNPLAIINEKAGLMKDLASLSDEFPQKEKILKNTDAILRSVDRCSAITHRLLGFAKRMDVKTETIDLGLLIQDVLTFLEKEASYRNIAINLQIPDNLPSIESDRGQLQQVFLNILNNAIDAVDDKGQIDIMASSDSPNAIQVKIRDNGQGISEENLKHIFEPFFTTKKEYGTGLGLSITYGIVERLGGKIAAESQIGLGTQFVVTLPIRSESS